MNLLQELTQTKAEIGLLWQGNNSWLISFQGTLLGVDLDLINEERIKPCGVSLEDLAQRLDLLLITHAHGDHFGSETVNRLLKGNCRFVLPESCLEIAGETGIPARRILAVKPGDVFEYPVHAGEAIKISCIRAIHGHIGGAIYSGADGRDCGYLMRLGTRLLYQPGDTVLLEEHQTMGKLDILFVSPTEHNTWIENSKKLIDFTDPALILPQHHSTYHETAENRFWSHGYVEELYHRLDGEQRKRFRILTQDTPVAVRF